MKTSTIRLIYGGTAALFFKIGDTSVALPGVRSGEAPQVVEVKVDTEDGKLPPNVARNLARLVADGRLQVQGATLPALSGYKSSAEIRKGLENA